jgi:GH24 family phage-related lysozyme (muramidase)
MNVAMLAAALIRVFEGVRLTAYQDSGGVWTIGFGHTGSEVVSGYTITMDQASSLLQSDAAPLLNLVEAEPLVAAAAYVSFGYDCGYHTLQTVLSGTTHLENYIHDRHGNVQPGLVTRRGLEAALIASVAPISA